MGISINVQAKTDYSYLFSGLGTAAGNAASSNWLADYAAIKNGSYGKLMKAYYAKDSSDEVKSAAKSSTVNQSSALSKDDTKTLSKVLSTTDALKESADKLIATDKKSVFAEGDTEAIYNAVNGFVADYNSVISAAGSASSDAIASRVRNMSNITSINSRSLEQMGIKVNDDKTLSIDKEAFLSADMDKVKNMFNDRGSYGYTMSAQASYINFAADQEANKANTYTFSGTYGNNYSAGGIFNSMF